MIKDWGFVFLLVILTACASPMGNSSFPSTPTAIQAGKLRFTSTPNPPTKSFSRTPRPSATPTLSPSATPTFDVASVVTRTPVPPQGCPAPAKVPLPDLGKKDFRYGFSPGEEHILDYLNQGGDPKKLIAELKRTWKRVETFTNNEVIQDLTGDGVPEILIIPLADLYIFGCRDGQYQILMSAFSDSVTMNGYLFQLVGIQDMNLNGIPEVVIAEFGGGGMGAGQVLDVFVYEWNGNQFASLIPEQDGFTGRLSINGGGYDEYLPDVDILDIDHNGTLELTLSGGIPNPWYDIYFSNAPWRSQSDTYRWNGNYFVFLKTEFSAPEYRYQAVQDGDRAMLRKEYGKALAFYQEAIFNEELLGWSSAHKERSKVLHALTWNFDLSGTPTPVIPPNDPQEYPNLAAYARYRIMLLHILQGHMSESQTIYETLQKKFPEGKGGYELTLIARAFWDDYQLSKSIGDACAKAISVASEHKEILKFLGSDYHNSTQDVMYEPKDVCPFQ